MDMSQVSDGKLYSVKDMAKLGCEDCKGCSSCCRAMGNSIVLDPYDVYRLTAGLKTKFDELLIDKIDLNVVEGIILPNLKMDAGRDSCVFLDENGRCSIHSLRPGMCRIFPLGRIYENGGFQYFLQIHECKKQSRTKVKIKKWIDTPDIPKNEWFINRWHYFLKNVSSKLPGLEQEAMKKIDMYILNVFFMTLYEEKRDFYQQFEERITAAEAWLCSEYNCFAVE